MRTLVYCGLGYGEGLASMHRNYDYIIAIDANPTSIEHAKRKVPNAHYLQVALSDEDDKEVTFNIYDKWIYSSSLGIVNHPALNGTPITKIQVKTRTLNSILDEHKIAKVDFLLTDLQGVDFIVLSSLGANLENGRILNIQHEATMDGQQSSYEFDNYQARFRSLLGNKYKLQNISQDHNECDMTWVWKG